MTPSKIREFHLRRWSIPVLSVFLVLGFLPLSALAGEDEQGVAWRVIAKEGAEIIAGILPIGSELLPGRQVISIAIERDHVRVCLKGKRDKAANAQCAFLFHADQGYAGDLKAGAFTVHTAETGGADALRTALARAMSKAPDTVWTKARHQWDFFPGFRHPWLAAGIRLLDGGSSDLTVRIVDDLKRGGADPRMLGVLQALLSAHQGNLQDAESHIRKISSDGSGDPLVALVHGRIQVMAGSTDGVKTLAESLANQPQGSRLRCETAEAAARFLAKTFSTDDRTSMWNGFFDRFSDCPGAVVSAVDDLLQTRHVDEAWTVLQKALKTHPSDQQLLHRKIQILQQKREWMEALKTLRQLTVLDPEDMDVLRLHTNIASSLPERDRQLQLEAIMLRLAENPGDALLLHTAAALAAHQGDCDRALELLDRLRVNMPDEPIIYLYGAICRYRQGDFEGAVRLMEELKAKDVFNNDVHIAEAIVYSSRDVERAIMEIELHLAGSHKTDDFFTRRILAEAYLDSLKRGENPMAGDPGRGGGDITEARGILALELLGAALAALVLGLILGRRLKRH